jgi:molecular chaperone GrpE
MTIPKTPASNGDSNVEVAPQATAAQPPKDAAAIAADYEQKLQDAEARALRSHAELENFRRRTRRDLDEQLKYASLPLINGVIEVVDNLTRALSAAESESSSSLVNGVRMVQSQLEQVLEKHGCKRIPTVNMPFDPNHHSALQMQASDTIPANTVVSETRSGYALHDRVVRPALVIVSTGPAK